MWRIVNEENGRDAVKSRCISKILSGNSVVKEGSKIAEILAEHFASASKKINLDKNSHTGDKVSKSMFFKPVTKLEVEKIIHNLKNSMTSGDDQIPMKILRYVATLVSDPLSKIINMSLLEGVCPSRLKITIVRPIAKKLNDIKLNNFRPIALLSVFSKVFESVVFTRLLDFFTKNKIISKKQHAYIKGKSTGTAIHDVYNIVKGLEGKKKYWVCF